MHLGNYIGVNANGTGADATVAGSVSVGNQGSGVVIEAVRNTVGGSSVNARNVISDNKANGVSIGTSLATANTVSANYIGVAANRTPLANRLNGIQISNLAAGNKIGAGDTSPGGCDRSCNLIANNGSPGGNSGRAGIYLDSSAGIGNPFRRNSIFSNTELGIDLAVPILQLIRLLFPAPERLRMTRATAIPDRTIFKIFRN